MSGAKSGPEPVQSRDVTSLPSTGEEVAAGGIPAVMRCNLEMAPQPSAMAAVPDGGTCYSTTSFVMAVAEPLPAAAMGPVLAAPPASAPLPTITVTRTDQDDSVLNRITQDLDYLLNRTTQEPDTLPPDTLPPAPPPPVAMPPSILRQTCSALRRPSCSMTIQEAVQEEEEEEQEEQERAKDVAGA